MGDGEQTSEREPRRALAQLRRAAANQVARLLTLLAILAIAGIGLVSVATAMQAQRDEARRGDLLLVIAPAVPAQPFIDHTFELYRRGYAPRLVVAGDGRKLLLDALRARGLPAEAATDAESSTLRPSQAAALQIQPGEGASALVVAQPEELLLTMKIARDMGLRAYGSPAPDQGIEPLALLRASGDYWRYVLLGQ